MSIYGKKSSSIAQKLGIAIVQIMLIALSFWILFMDGQIVLANLFGWSIFESPPTRRWIIFAFTIIVFLRLTYTMFFVMKRSIPWIEVLSVPAAFALYYVGFAVLTLSSNAPIGLWDALAIAIFLFGSWLNTASEHQRDAFKAKPQNKGKLFTGGLFAHAMHINFFGDILWILAYAMVTLNPWSMIIVVFITLFFALINVPMLDKYLAPRYGQDFIDYAKKTKRLVPFIW